MVYIMVIITLETDDSLTITTKSFMAENINWSKLMRVMKDDPQYKYSIKVLEK